MGTHQIDNVRDRSPTLQYDSKRVKKNACRSSLGRSISCIRFVLLVASVMGTQCWPQFENAYYNNKLVK